MNIFKNRAFLFLYLIPHVKLKFAFFYLFLFSLFPFLLLSLFHPFFLSFCLLYLRYRVFSQLIAHLSYWLRILSCNKKKFPYPHKISVHIMFSAKHLFFVFRFVISQVYLNIQLLIFSEKNKKGLKTKYRVNIHIVNFLFVPTILQ